ncbi:MAG: hypothetical protein HY298_08320 [Verrucomicrobia bacterium]|nr:hypothetical protein [Verrucomicrobiota bacterium]
MNSRPPGARSSGRSTSWLLVLMVSMIGLHLTSTARATTHISIAYHGANVTLSWNASPGTTYEVQSRSNLATGTWTTNETIIAEDNTANWADPDPLDSTRFYRLLMPNGEQTLFEFPPEMPWALPAFSDRTPMGESEIWWFSVPPVSGRGGVNGFSGEFVLASVDLHISGRGPDFIWARKYRSRVGPDTAQGNGWDYSYNIFARRVGSHVEVHDGNSRRDVFLLQPDGTFALDSFFREGSIANNAFTLMFADKGTWEFHPFDHPTSPGKLRRSTDRNGNAMEFQYDDLSRLVRVIDTLGRTNTVSYDGNGFISAVIDFTGRQVRYEYYGNADPDGSPGDLKLAISPAVTGTPNANDFPGGKTNRYTYSKGQPLNALNHNLLTITDPLGQTWLSNRYAATLTATNVNFDHLESESVGFSYEKIKIEYAAQTPGPTNNGALKKAIVNDRVGNVREYYYDGLNRLVMHRAFTGRADPTQPTTESVNRPINPMRPGDPPYFEKRIEWNADSLPTRVVHPNTNETQFVYESAINPSASPRLRGNLRALHRLPGPLGGDQPVRSEQFEYAPGFGTSRAGVLAMDADTDNDGNPDQLSSYLRDHNNITFTYAAYAAGGDHSTLQQGSEPPADPNIPLLGFRIVYVDTVEISINGREGMRNQNIYCTQHTDARSNFIQYAYDSRGNRIHATNRIATVIEDWEYNSSGQLTAHVLPDNGSGSRRRDEYSYYSAGPQTGYLQQQVVDAGGFNLTTTYEYDAVGNLVRRVDPRTNDTLYAVNALNQIVRRTSRETTNGSGVRYQRDYFYDANNNLVRVDIEDKDETGALRPGSPLTTTFAYDSLNFLTARMEEEEVGYDVVTQYQYDANRNRTLVRFGAATSGADSNNVVQMLYDERDLPFGQIRAPGSADQSTTQFDYDLNGSMRRMSQGLESTPRVTDYTYDGYNRLTQTTDAMGNVTTAHYDANGNIVTNRTDGETTDAPGSAGNVRLRETVYQYDAMNRLIRRDRSFFDTATQLPIGDGQSTTQYGYNDCSQFIVLSDDLFNQMFARYDMANRLLQVTDAKSNTVAYAYDANGSVVSKINVDKSDLGDPEQTFVTTYAYDNLDRLIRSVDNLNNTNRWSYDSRHNLVLDTDARGNTTRYAYDGLSRLTRTTRAMTDTGTGAGTVTNNIITLQDWDDSSRLISVTDANSNRTVYAYDSLDRRIRTEHPDTTTNYCVYDPHFNLVTNTDPNSNVITRAYDSLNRITNKTVLRGPSIQGNTNEVYQYDGVSRLVRALDDDSLVTRSYDSLSRIVTETQQILPGGPTRTNSATYDGVGNKTQQVYPGGRTITNTCDSLNRIAVVSDAGGVIASNKYIGPSRLEQRDYGNGTRMNVGYDGIRRVSSIAHVRVAGNVPLDMRFYAWDSTHNRIAAQAPLNPAEQHSYSYDSANRLVQSVSFGQPVTCDLDDLGNRRSVTGNIDPGNYLMDPTLPQPADFQMNQYTQTPFDLRQYDENGNLSIAASGQRRFFFDCRDQLVGFNDFGAGINALYRYDCLGRRIESFVNGETTRFYHDNATVLEEQNADNTTVASYVYVDNDDAEVVFCSLTQMQRGGSNYFLHPDDLGSVMKVTDPVGNIVEQYQYLDFGLPSFFNGGGGAMASSTIGNPYLFQAMRFDPEMLFYQANEAKSEPYRPTGSALWASLGGALDPRTGRTISRLHHDPRIWNDSDIVQAATAFADNNPVSSIHPRREYAIQYNDAALSFVSRLLEHEGIFYSVTAGDGKDTVVFCDEPGATDTEVRRSDPLSPFDRGGPPTQPVVPIEMLQLELHSCMPITITPPKPPVPPPSPQPPRVSPSPWVSPGVDISGPRVSPVPWVPK